MNSQSNSTKFNNIKSQMEIASTGDDNFLLDSNKGQHVNTINMISQNEEDIFEEDDKFPSIKNDLKSKSNTNNIKSFRLSDSSPLFESEDEDDEDRNHIIKNTIAVNKDKKHINDDSDGYLDLSEEDEGELDVSDEIKNDNKIQVNKNVPIQNESKIAQNNDIENEYDSNVLISNLPQDGHKTKGHRDQTVFLAKKKEEDINENIQKVNNEHDMSANYSDEDYVQNKSHIIHFIKQEFMKTEIDTLLEALFLHQSIDIYISDIQVEMEEQHKSRRRKDQRSESTSYNEHTEEEISKNHRRRKHRRSKYDNEYEEKSANNELLGNDEIEIINNSPNHEEEENGFLFEEEIKKDEKIEPIKEEEENNEKENLPEIKGEENAKEKKVFIEKDEEENLFEIEEEEEDVNEKVVKNDEKEKDLFKEYSKDKFLFIEEEEEEEEMKEKHLFAEEEEKSQKEKDFRNNKEEQKNKKKLFNEEEEEKEVKNQKIKDLFNEEEEKEKKKEEEKVNYQKIKDLFNEEEEEMENQIKKESFFEEEEEINDKFNEEESFISNENSKPKESKENKSEEEANETISCIPSEQFGVDLNISPIKKTNKEINKNLANLTDLSKSESDENKKSSFKQKILQQFSNEENDDYSNGNEKQQKSYQNSFEPPQSEYVSNSGSLVTNPGSSIISEISTEIIKKKVRRRRKIPIDNKIGDEQIDNQKIDNNKADANLKQQKPKINKKGKRKPSNKLINTGELVNGDKDLEDNHANNSIDSKGQNDIITTPIRTKKVIKKRARSAQKPSNNKLSTTPTEIEISSLKTKKIKPRSESVKHTKKHKKPLTDMSTQTDKFQIDENNVFIFEKVKSRNTYHFITNNKFYDLEITNGAETETETENTDKNLPVINKKKKKTISPAKKKKSSVSKSKKNNEDEIKKFNEKMMIRKNQPPKRNMSEEPRIRKKFEPIEDSDDDDDNIVIDFGDTMYSNDQRQYSPQAKIDAKKKEKLINQFHPKQKSRNGKSSPIHFLTLTTTKESFPESEQSDFFRNNLDKIDSIGDKNPIRTNHQWNMDEIYENNNSSNKNKTLKTKTKNKPKAKSRTKKRSKSVSLGAKKYANNKSIEVYDDNKHHPMNDESKYQDQDDNDSFHLLPAIKKRNTKRHRKQKEREAKTYDGNDEFEKEDDSDRFNYDDDIRNQKQPKNNRFERSQPVTSRFNDFYKVNTVDLMKDIANIKSPERNQNHYYSNETIRHSSIEVKPLNKNHLKMIEITDSIAYETEEIVDFDDYSDEFKDKSSYEAPKELFDTINLAFHCTTWEAALNGIYNIDIVQIPPKE